jgi:hypothetical protein
MIAATDIPTPNPTFAPVDKPPGDGDGIPVSEDVFVGDTLGDIGVVPAVAVARSSTAESVACHMMGTPSPCTYPAEAWPPA